MQTVVVGTAGHVDHGKTSLVKALTGIDTDRMQEEKVRGISMDIGFAHLELENELVLDFVDVPGHERFVRNMLCGATGVDLAILVVAADDGVMPQTREHFDILGLLGVKKGLIVVSKADLVDEETLEMAELEIAELVEGSFLENAPILRFSAATGFGVREVLESLAELARSIPPKRTDTAFRLPIDKVYVSQGRGTVVTGTVAGGSLDVGEDIAVYPARISGKARSIQVHRRMTETASAGQRVGINVAGVEADSVSRGSVVARPESLVVSRMANVEIALLPSADRPLKQRERIKIHVGTKELVCRVVLMDREVLEPAETAYAQLRCEEEIVALPGDSFVARSLSPARTIGGGRILQISARKYRRFDSRVLMDLKAISSGDDRTLVENSLKGRGYRVSKAAEISPKCGFVPNRVERVLAGLAESGRAISIGDGYVHSESLSEVEGILKQLLLAECERRVIKRRFKIAEVRGKLAFEIDDALLDELLRRLEKEGVIELKGSELVVRSYEVRLSVKHAEIAEVARRLYRSSHAPVRYVSLKSACPRGAAKADIKGILSYLADEEEIVLFDDLSFISKGRYEEIKKILGNHLARCGKVTLAEARDIIGIGRNPLQTILERLDDEGFTKRKGDVRVLSEAEASNSKGGTFQIFISQR